ncbi:MAG: HAD family hydrolase [Nitrososphaerota archaeon]|nr:HAD family hydrolase [Nitrososphaerota archaeon]
MGPGSGDIDAVVFDLDGTLFHLPVDWKAVRRDLEASYGSGFGGAPIFAKLRELSRSEPGALPRLFAVIDSYEVRAAEDASPVGGSLALLSSARSRRPLALVTMQGRKATARVLARFGLVGSFAAVLTREDSLSREAQILSACRTLGSPPSRALFVGDKRSDLEDGKAAGAKVALVGRRASPEWGGDYYSEDPAGLAPMV